MFSTPRLSGPFLVVALLATLGAATVSAKPTYRRAFFNVYTSAVNSRLDNLPSHATHCGVCHYDFNGAGPKNPYGNRLAAVLAGYATTELAIQAIQGEDPDGDGFTSLAEITDLTHYSNTQTFPGLTPGNVSSTVNVPNLTEISPYLVPAPLGDTQAPAVTVTSPNGAESWTGESGHTISWTATDNVGVISVDLYYRDAGGAAWTPIAKAIANTGSLAWFVPNTPTSAARVRVVARDASSNVGADSSNAAFTIVAKPGGIVPTTLRDFHQAGTQPFGGGTFQDHTTCMGCHGNYDPAVEPGHNFEGMMMAQAARDPLFYACLAIANQDAPSSGDMCLRCHTPFGWMSGRSTPTDASQLTALDRDGLGCDFCHRAVDPIYKPGVSPAEDPAVLDALLPAHPPTTYANGQYVVDPDPRKRGPFSDTVAPHAVLTSSFHRSGDFCGTCHDVSNPVFNRTGLADYAPGAFDAAADSISSLTLMPLERTYSEWKHSAFPAGVYAPEFAGNKPDGTVASCQDCHLRAVTGTGCNDPAAPIRTNLPLHDMMGGNAWMPGVIAALYPGETNAAALADGAVRAESLLSKAAVLAVDVQPEVGAFQAAVTVTNRTGHKLPTGYPEGRRMWLHVVARDESGTIVYESGHYDAASGVLTLDADIRVYEAHLGLSPALAGALGLAGGPTFHFALNDSVYKDNRIPPQGFTKAAFEAFGGQPADPEYPGPGARYADGQNWDTASYAIPGTARTLTAELLYQTTSKEYVDFLRDQNTSNGAGQALHDAWTAHGRAAPVVMATAADTFGVVFVPYANDRVVALEPRRNPFQGALDLRLDLPAPADVALEIFDVRGRRVASRDYGWLGGGAHRLAWDGRNSSGHDAGSGAFWIRAKIGDVTLVRGVVRLR